MLSDSTNLQTKWPGFFAVHFFCISISWRTGVNPSVGGALKLHRELIPSLVIGSSIDMAYWIDDYTRSVADTEWKTKKNERIEVVLYYVLTVVHKHHHNFNLFKLLLPITKLQDLVYQLRTVAFETYILRDPLGSNSFLNWTVADVYKYTTFLS